MTKHATFAALVALVGPTLAFAQSATDLDQNGDGVLVIEEVQATYPEVSSDMFAAMDLNADGAVDGDEFAAAQEAGLMPASDG